jgi:hypothetical protein
MLRNKRLGTAALLSMLLVLTACGGGGGGGGGGGPDAGNADATRSQVPDSAQQSVGGLVAFLKELIGQTSETTVPVVLGDAVLPRDDNAEPAPVN